MALRDLRSDQLVDRRGGRPMRSHRTAVAALVLLLAACGDGSTDAADTSTGGGAPEATDAGRSTPVAAGDDDAFCVAMAGVAEDVEGDESSESAMRAWEALVSQAPAAIRDDAVFVTESYQKVLDGEYADYDEPAVTAAAERVDSYLVETCGVDAFGSDAGTGTAAGEALATFVATGSGARDFSHRGEPFCYFDGDLLAVDFYPEESDYEYSAIVEGFTGAPGRYDADFIISDLEESLTGTATLMVSRFEETPDELLTTLAGTVEADVTGERWGDVSVSVEFDCPPEA